MKDFYKKTAWIIVIALVAISFPTLIPWMVDFVSPLFE
jgi:hypothetical protein